LSEGDLDHYILRKGVCIGENGDERAWEIYQTAFERWSECDLSIACSLLFRGCHRDERCSGVRLCATGHYIKIVEEMSCSEVDRMIINAFEIVFDI
jgi:hypothetical protein